MVYESPERIIAPWDKVQLASLVAYQEIIFAQQRYYCDLTNHHPPLMVTENHMLCSTCGKKQFWVFDIACNWKWRSKLGLYSPNAPLYTMARNYGFPV